MRFEDSDERDIDREQDARFRIILFDGPQGFALPEWAANLPTTDALNSFEVLREEELAPSGFNTEVVDVLDADFVDVFDLAVRLAGQSKQFAITLIHDTSEGRGQTWITGTDLNRAAADDATQSRQRQIMLDRPRCSDEVAAETLEWLRGQP